MDVVDRGLGTSVQRTVDRRRETGGHPLGIDFQMKGKGVMSKHHTDERTS